MRRCQGDEAIMEGMNAVIVGTGPVSCADVVAVARDGAAVALSAEAEAAGSPVVASHRGPEDTRVQDAYSLRCSPQVHGAARDTLAHATAVAGHELASAIDNPVITTDGRLVSNGNFHGAPVAYVLDFLAIVTADVASIAERRKLRRAAEAVTGPLK
jgi:histidine ammonia-lyase